MLQWNCMKKLDVDENDGTTWFRDLERHKTGKSSMAAYQASTTMEDYSQVEVGDNCLFAGIYDGHNGPHAAEFISNYILRKLWGLIRENDNVMSYQHLRDAVAATQKEFIYAVGEQHEEKPDMMRTGSCCLICLLWKETLYIANLGDSRLVIGSEIGNTTVLKAQPLTKDHSCENLATRIALRQRYRDDPTIVLDDENGWKVKALSKVTRTIGDAYLKRPIYTILTNLKNVSKPYGQAVVSSEPEIHSRIIGDDDRCLIIASRGFWQIMSNEEAMLVVERHSQQGIAKKLLMKAREKLEKTANNDPRRVSRDDITVIVIYLNEGKSVWKRNRNRNVPKLSYRIPSDLPSPKSILAIDTIYSVAPPRVFEEVQLNPLGV